jgi:hypothetical protein
MTKESANPSIEEKIYAATRTPTPRPEFLAALSTRLANTHRDDQPDRGNPDRPAALGLWLAGFFRPAWSLAGVILLVLAAIFIAIGPRRVLAEANRLLGYLPSIGLVQSGSELRVLAAPVQMERAGTTLTIEQGAADQQRTVIIYRVEGLSSKASKLPVEGNPMRELVVLLLPDGSILTQNDGSLSGWGTGYQARLIFPPLPGSVHAATLMVARLESMPAGAAPEGWRIPIQFKPAPADLKTMPVYELTTPQSVSAAPVSTATQLALSATPNQATASLTSVSQANGVQFNLKRVIELADGYQLEGSLSWDTQTYANLSTNPLAFPAYSLQDKRGQAIPFEEVVTDSFGSPDFNANQSGKPWAIRTNSKAFPGPWQLSIAQLLAFQVVKPDQAVIQVDFGADPQSGQSWALNQDLQIAGHVLRVTSARLESEPRNGGLILQLAFAADPSVTGVSVEDPQNQPVTSSSGSGGGGPASMQTAGAFSASIPYSIKPGGIHQVQVTGIGFLLDGPWAVRWDPPAQAEQPAPTQPVAYCQIPPTWEQARNQAQAALPQGLSGQLLVEENQGQLLRHLALLNVDGSQRQDLLTGAWSDLSPDGKTLVFIENYNQGLSLLDLASGQKQLIPGTQSGDYHPLWSPDGQWLAYNHANAGIYIVRPDGSEQRKVADESRIRFLAGWLPDGRGLVITSLGEGGSELQKIDLQTGQLQNYFTINNVKGGFVRLSRDGKQVAYSEMTFGLPSYGVYIENLDGTGKRLLAGMETGAVGSGAWSPSGRWLALTVIETKGEVDIEHILLVDVNTCQTWLVPGVQGSVAAWREQKK